MKTTRMKTTLLIILAASVILILPGCATKKDAWGDVNSGIIMKYSYAPGNDYRYHNTFNFEQKMKVMEQEYTVTSKGEQVLNMQPQKAGNEELELRVTVDEMHAVINSPQGEMKAELDSIIGKSFNFTVSWNGKELEYSEADKLAYGFGTGEKKTIGSDVQGFFPDLPGHPVKPGDTWESHDKITESIGKGSIVMDITNYNTFEKLESYKGYECMKITYTFTGILTGKGEEAGMKMSTSGKLEGTGTWYFAYREGVFVSQSVEGQGTTETQITGPREMTLPATRTYTMLTELKP